MYDVFFPLVCVSFTQFPFPGQLLGAIYMKTIQKLSQPITHEVSNKNVLCHLQVTNNSKMNSIQKHNTIKHSLNHA